jgi:hypothetical protein
MVVRLHGGLGNQLFQLLAARYLAKDKKQGVRLYPNDLSKFSTKRNFEIQPLIAEQEVTTELNRIDQALFKYKLSKVLAKLQVHAIADVAAIDAWSGQHFNGYFQDIFNYRNYKLLSGIVKGIDDQLGNITHRHLGPFDVEYASTGAVHLRLTDFVQHLEGEKFLREFRLPYIQKAAEYLHLHFNVKKFIVFTDDIELAKKLLQDEWFVFFQDSLQGKLTLLQEFYFLASFKYLITSNSTFSYWSTVFGRDKTIIFPSLWKNDDKKENAVFLRNIEMHSTMFPANNFIKII